MKTAIQIVRPASVQTAVFSLFALCAVTLAQTTPTILPLLPPNGEVNPYGVVFAPKNVPAGRGLHAGDILVSNFNNAQNLQGRGSTIVRVDRTGAVSTFYTASSSRVE